MHAFTFATVMLLNFKCEVPVYAEHLILCTLWHRFIRKNNFNQNMWGFVQYKIILFVNKLILLSNTNKKINYRSKYKNYLHISACKRYELIKINIENQFTISWKMFGEYNHLKIMNQVLHVPLCKNHNFIQNPAINQLFTFGKRFFIVNSKFLGFSLYQQIKKQLHQRMM